MYNLGYSIIVTLLHSVWQMAILLLLYYSVVNIFKQWPPIAKRNLLLTSLAVQFLLSIFTFLLIQLGQQENLLTTTFKFEWLSPATTLPQQWFSYLLGIYLVGFSYKILGNYLKWKRQISFLQQHLQKAPAEMRMFVSQKAMAFGIKRNVEIWLSEHVSSPLTYGFLKPVILFPLALCNQLSMAQAEALIVHELTHIRTRDYLYNWMLVIAESIYFFNPFVKIIANNIRLEREKNCDVQVIDFSYSSLLYAEALLQVAHNSSNHVRMSIPAVRNKNELLNRIQYFSKGNSSKRNFSIWPAVTAMCALLVFLNLVVFNLVKEKNNELLASKFPIVLNLGYDPDGNNESYASFVTEPIDPLLEKIKENTTPGSTPSKINVTKNDKQEDPILSDVATAAPETNYTNESFTENYIQPVAFTTAVAPEVKEMIITEENSAGEKITKSYTVILEKGEWKVQPQWMYTEKLLTDSLKAAIKKDSAILKVFPTVQ